MKKHVHLTWYILADGTHADPDDCSPGKDGVLRHKDGLAVALRDNGVPMSIGVAAVTGKNVLAAELGQSDAPPPDVAEPRADKAEDTPVEPLKTTDMEPEPAPPPAPKAKYKTRGK